MSEEEDDDWTGTETGRQVAEAFDVRVGFVQEGDHAKVTCYAAPLQVEGIYHGHPFYFRARHGHWSLGIGPAGADLDAAVMASFKAFQATGIPQVGQGIGPGYSWGRPEPDDQEIGGTFGGWLLLRLAEICK